MSQTAILNNEIKVAAINVNSIISNSRRLDLLKFLQEYSHDALLISETKLNARYKISFKNYHVLRTDRPNAKQGGGTAIIIKRNIPFERISYPTSMVNEILEYTIIKIILSNSGNLFLVSIYAKFDNRKLFSKELFNLFSNLRLQDDNNYFIIAGDINARRIAWGDRLDNQRGRYMKQWEDSFGIAFRIRIITSSGPTFKPANSFLDICIADARLKLSNSINGKANTLPYDSDHAAIAMSFELSINNAPLWNPVPDRYRFNFKATKWHKFTRRLGRDYNSNIPNDRNLSITEIDDNLNNINSVIYEAIVNNIPKFKQDKSVQRYLNHNIRKLLKIKSYLVSVLHDLHISDPLSNRPISLIAKSALIDTRKALQLELKISTDKYWSNKIKQIDYSKQDAFFPKINAICRAKQFSNIENLKIKVNDFNILNRSKCDMNKAHKIGNDYVFTAPQDKLNIIGAFYETINSPRHLNSNTPHKQLIDETAESIKNNFKISRDLVNTITQFSRENPASNPNSIYNHLHPFCNPWSIELIFKNLTYRLST
ncbi:PREDICTED: uncharacterized protein LOC107192981 [Dufourea novaeangliae]|uniref:uncharacterized protein LOC107192981 n=1 Tax=Dufourea novaeangliae TaxID=178035 RepID=UPI0007671EF3|nr:PREDICTED: uncharacterized protein LOC107192981 [Dufourea novaeangliae]